MTDASSAPADLPVLLLLFAAVFFGLLVTSVVAWVWFLVNLKQVRLWTGWQGVQPASRIGFIDLIGCACCMIVAQFLMLGTIQAFLPKASITSPDVVVTDQDTVPTASPEPKKTGEIPKWLAPVLTLSFLIGGALSVLLLYVRTGANLKQLGIHGTEWIRDGGVGLIAFVLVTPVILIFSNLVVRLTDVEYKHPVIDAMKQYPWTFPLLFFGAVICAPLWEEFVFRGLLIRWFDSIRQSRGNFRGIVLGGNAPNASTPEPTDETTLDVNTPESTNPYQPLEFAAQESRLNTATSNAADPKTTPECFPPWWPAILSGVLFGLAHISYGMSWVPLILFGIVLGRLFQLRRSIFPCVVLHACFNGLSMLGMAAQIFSK